MGAVETGPVDRGLLRLAPAGDCAVGMRPGAACSFEFPEKSGILMFMENLVINK